MPRKKKSTRKSKSRKGYVKVCRWVKRSVKVGARKRRKKRSKK